jgi:glycine/D-amino acid oxidase-like deaminating enzyme
MSVQNPGSAFRDQKGRRSYSFNYEHGFDYLSQNPHTGQIFIGGGELSGFDGGLSIHGISSDAEESIPAKSHLTGVLPVIFGRDGWGEEKPGTPTLHASWTGILCNSLDGAPMVGMLPQEALGSRRAGQRHAGAEWISAGYGGYGMVNAWRCGKAVAKQLLGKESPELPPPYRITPARMVKLSTRLAEIAGSGEHLRALL